MVENSLSRVLRHIRMVAAVHAYRDLADGELLSRFVNANDESAFTVVMERHGAMVLGVCRRALGNLHDAEDVCQATFLVLAQQGGLAKSPKLSDWEVELRIPQKHLNQLLQTYRNQGPQAELDLVLLVPTMPTRTFTGKLAKSKIALPAHANPGASNVTEPDALAFVRISGADIPEDCRLAPELLVAGTEVRALVPSRE